MLENDSKKNIENLTHSSCECKSSTGLYVQNRQLSLVVASILLLNFCLFMGGYFLGQKNIISVFSNKIEQESFSDQIYSSMCSLCDNGEVEENTEDTEEADSDEQSTETELGDEQSANEVQPEESAATIISKPATVDATDAAAEEKAESQEVAQSESTDVAETQYYAQLIGFGSARTAQQFAQKLTRKEIPVVVKKRQSRSARGRFVSWYQVVTEKFNDRQELESLITKLEREEKITGVQIATC